MSIRLDTRAPFHLEATVRVLQRRPTNPVNVWDHGCYRRVLDVSGSLVLIEVANRGGVDDPDVRCTVRHGRRDAATRSAVVRSVREVLGLDVDPAPLEAARSAEPLLNAATRGLRGMRPPRYPGLFEAFANVVPFQQVSIDAGAAITGRLVERFGEYVELGGTRFPAFPSAETIADAPPAGLRECGLSARKAETLQRLGLAIASGALSQVALASLSSDDALRTLTGLPGIGPWSAALVLLRGFGRTDVFPPGDVGARRSLRALMGLAPDAQVEKVVERFGGQRGYVYFCGLGSNLLAKGLIQPA